MPGLLLLKLMIFETFQLIEDFLGHLQMFVGVAQHFYHPVDDE